MDMQCVVDTKRKPEQKLKVIKRLLFDALEKDLESQLDDMVKHHLTVSKMDDFKSKSKKSRGVVYHKNMNFIYSLN
jgi:hypothetical protein